MNVNGWNLRYFLLFRDIISQLISDVLALREKDPDGYKTHPKTKLLAAVRRAVFTDVPADPNHKKYRLGKTLGSKYASWRRVKKGGLDPRYRLFFRFLSQKQSIIFTWMNDDSCLRQEGGQNDLYKVFGGLLKNGKIPNDFNELTAKSVSAPPLS